MNVASFLLNVRHATRQLGARPGFSLAALVILSVAIGGNTATFSLVHGLLFRPLPYPDSERIVSVGQVQARRPEGFPRLSSSQLQRLQEEAGSFEYIAGYAPRSVVLDGPDGVVDLFGAAVTPSLFPLLRTTPQRGRLFANTDAVEGAHRIVLLSHGTWTNRFGSDPDIVGASIELDGQPHVVAGVFSTGFDFPTESTEFWIPLVLQPDDEPGDGGFVIRGAYIGLGRLREGVSPERAATEVRTILARTGPEQRLTSRMEFETRVIPLREERGRPFRRALVMLAAAAGAVLLMACTNVAGLLLARSIARRKEFAIRRALGAPRGRIVRQLLTESAVVGVAGGSAGFAIATAIVDIAPGLVPLGVPGLAALEVDGAVFAFAAGLSVVSCLLFGTVPALTGSRVDLVEILNDANAPPAGVGGRLRASKAQAALVVGQVSLALVLLAGTGLLLRSFVALVTVDLGLDPANVVIARADDPTRMRIFGGGSTRFGSDELAAMMVAAHRFRETLLTQVDRIGNLPGVEAVALTSQMPLSGSESRPIGVAGRPPPHGLGERLQAGIRRVSPGYADVVRLRLLAGRFFTERDAAGSPRVAVVSESFARQAFGGEPAVGQHLTQSPIPFPETALNDNSQRDETWEVVGIVADVTSPFRRDSLSNSDAAGDVYLCMLQAGNEPMPFMSPAIVVVRTAGDPPPVVPFLREVLADTYPGALVDTTVLETALAARAVRPRFYAMYAGIFAAVALLLAAFGLYSLLSQAVSRRRREIGVRMALGAGNRAVLLLILRQGGLLVGIGVMLGLFLATAVMRIIESLLFSVTPVDPLTFTAVTTVLLATGLVACWFPAHRATKIDAMDVLRER